MSYVSKYKAQKIIDDFKAKFPEAQPRKERYFFGLLTRTIYTSYDDLIKAGKITPEEADEQVRANLTLYGFEK